MALLPLPHDRDTMSPFWLITDSPSPVVAVTLAMIVPPPPPLVPLLPLLPLEVLC